MMEGDIVICAGRTPTYRNIYGVNMVVMGDNPPAHPLYLECKHGAISNTDVQTLFPITKQNAGCWVVSIQENRSSPPDNTGLLLEQL